MKNRSIIITTKSREKKSALKFGNKVELKIASPFRSKWADEGEVHLNLWKDSTFSLDIGIKLFDYSEEVEAVYIYVPYTLDRSNISDLGRKMQTKAMVDTVFNDSFSVKTDDEKSRLRYFVSDSSDMAIYSLPDGNIQCEVLDKGLGSIITLALNCIMPPNADSHNLYVRVRLSLPEGELSKLRAVEELSNDVLQAAFSQSELYDIRVNDFRNVDNEVYDKLLFTKKCKPLKFRKAHLFYMTDIKEQVISGNAENTDTRILELEKWEDYIKLNKTKHQILAYHWSLKCPKGSTKNTFEAFYRVICKSKSLWKPYAYGYIVIWLGACGSFAVSADKDWAWNCPALYILLAMTIISIIIFLVFRSDK